MAKQLCRVIVLQLIATVKATCIFCHLLLFASCSKIAIIVSNHWIMPILP